MGAITFVTAHNNDAVAVTQMETEAGGVAVTQMEAEADAVAVTPQMEQEADAVTVTHQMETESDAVAVTQMEPEVVAAMTQVPVGRESDRKVKVSK